MSGQACGEAVGRIASANAGCLAVQMGHWIFVTAAVVLICRVVEFLFEHMRDLRVDEDLQG
jgi:hypothetical protein